MVLQAIKELIRVAKTGGYVIILELFNRHKLFSSIIFYLTLFFSCFGFHFEMIGLRKNVIVSFLTPNEIRNALTRNGKVEIVRSTENNDIPKAKYNLLMQNIGRLLVIGKKIGDLEVSS
jgi:ubiquinone/menaquinone biosynthesis C-methylase UbiE